MTYYNVYGLSTCNCFASAMIPCTRYTTTGREISDRRKLAAMQTDREANSPLRQLTAKAPGSKKHFTRYASRQLFIWPCEFYSNFAPYRFWNNDIKSKCFNDFMTIPRVMFCTTLGQLKLSATWASGTARRWQILRDGFDSRLEPIALRLYTGWLLTRRVQALFAVSLNYCWIFCSM